ncbi:hypothetical protein BBJ28_00021889 [Nothophytophthora sp. Chile5]|nr:hypothetical protein BBJ28_00021889 [Nothophytophthora sp. Chile5]
MAQEGPSERQMHLAMQEQMNFHRQILTRKVQVSRNLSPSENTDSSNVSESTDNRDDNNDPADPQQQMNPFLRLPPRRPLTEGARALPSSPSTADAEGSVGQGSQSDDEGLDLYRWARFNLNVGMEDDDLFDFLES